MKIVLANKFFFPNGGSEVVYFQERTFLQRAGMEVIDFAMQDRRNLPSPYSADFVPHRSLDPQHQGPLQRLRAAAGMLHSPAAVARLDRLIRRTRPDLLHCHNIYHQLTPSIIRTAKRHGLPVVLTLHDYKPICPVYTRLRHGSPCSACTQGNFRPLLSHRCADGSLGKSALLYLEARVQQALRSYEQVDLILAPSAFMRQAVTAWRFPPDRVEVLYNGVDAPADRTPGMDGGYALFLGRLSPEKGIETLLQAHRDLSARLPLQIAGTGPLEPTLRQRYPQVRFRGHLQGAELQQTLADAACVVVPSEWYENCPMAVLEAMALGKTVIASAIGGIPELIRDGETGLLHAPGDRDQLRLCLLRLAESPTLRQRLGAAAQARARQAFSLQAHNRRLLCHYLRLVSPATARGARARLTATPFAT